MDDDELTEDGPFAASSKAFAPSSTLPPASYTRGERYGRTPSSKRNGRLIALLFGGAVVLVIGAWVIWAGLDGAQSTVNTQDRAHTVVSDHRVDVTFDIGMDPGRSATCAVEAQNEAHAVVGWKIIDVPSSAQRDQEITTTVLTTEAAVTGLVDSCWLT